MLFIFEWWVSSRGRQGGNRWQQNKFTNWDKCEQRIKFLESQNISIRWITAIIS